MTQPPTRACPAGSEPKPGFEGELFWISVAASLLPGLAELRRVAPQLITAITQALVSVDGICAENPVVPAPFDTADLLEAARTVPVFGLLPQTAVVEKAYAWLRYEQFLHYCQCKVPPPTPGNNCTAAPPTLTTGAFNSILGPFPVTIDQAIMDSIVTHPNGDWTWYRSGAGTMSGSAPDPTDIRIEIQLTNGSWLFVDTLASLQAGGGVCLNKDTSAATTRFSSNTAVRLVNQGVSGQTINNFQFCFCTPVIAPVPLPPQPPFPDVPSAPLVVCGDSDLCTLILELMRRLSNVSAQVSDIQAAVSGADVLRELARQDMTPEGEAELVLGTRAVSVELTALGGEAYTSALGRPRGLMRVGSVRWGDGVGYSPRRFIDADRFDDLRPGGAVSISWQLLPGTHGILKFLG